MPDFDRWRVYVVIVIFLILLGLAGREDYRAQLVEDQLEDFVSWPK